MFIFVVTGTQKAKRKRADKREKSLFRYSLYLFLTFYLLAKTKNPWQEKLEKKMR
jgi:hypothetical protein